MPRSRRARRKGAAIFTASALALLAIAGYFAYSAYQRVTPLLTGPGCQAGRGTSAVSLDPQQASIAATIAAVAAGEQLPARAVTIAYATAMQESHMHNLNYGDLDSVGVFQQRPSEGWGTASQLEDPVYATTKFFGALTHVRGYLADAGGPGRPGRPAQRRWLRLLAIRPDGDLTDQRVHRRATARRVVLGRPWAAPSARAGRCRNGTGRGVRGPCGRQASNEPHQGPFG